MKNRIRRIERITEALEHKPRIVTFIILAYLFAIKVNRKYKPRRLLDGLLSGVAVFLFCATILEIPGLAGLLVGGLVSSYIVILGGFFSGRGVAG